MSNFIEIKKIVLEKAKENGACEDAYKKAYKSESMPELCEVLKDNFNWGCNHNVITPEFIEQFKDEFSENEIYVNCNVTKGYLLAWGSATVEASGSATVRAWGSAYINCKSTIKCKLSDKAIVRRWDTNTIQFCDESMKLEKVEAVQ
jgi:hypothetical protein